MSCYTKSVSVYSLVQSKDDEGYLNPSYSLDSSFKADVQIMSGEKAIKEYGISGIPIAHVVYPTRKQSSLTSSNVLEKIIGWDGQYFDIVFSDFEVIVTGKPHEQSECLIYHIPL